MQNKGNTLINFRVEYIKAEDVITFCLFPMNKMKFDLDKVTPFFQVDDVIVYLTLGRTRKFIPHRGTREEGGGGRGEGGGGGWNPSPEFLIRCSISKRFSL